MEKKDNKRKINKADTDFPASASAYECTGMMYKPPESEAELDSYMELYSMEIPKENE